MRAARFIAIAAAVLAPFPAQAQVYFNATPILQSRTTVLGTPIVYPKTDSAEVTALVLEIGPGGETGRHMHPYPTFVYMLDGAIDVEAEGGVTHSYRTSCGRSSAARVGPHHLTVELSPLG